MSEPIAAKKATFTTVTRIGTMIIERIARKVLVSSTKRVSHWSISSSGDWGYEPRKELRKASDASGKSCSWNGVGANPVMCPTVDLRGNDSVGRIEGVVSLVKGGAG